MTSTQYFKDVATQWDTMRKGFFSENVRDKAYAVAEVAAGQTAADLGAGTGFIKRAGDSTRRMLRSRRMRY